MKKYGNYITLSALALMATAGMAYAEPTTINLCTGGQGGPYNLAGDIIAKQLNGNPNVKINVVVDTGGTWGNIQRSTQAETSTQPTPEDYAAGSACQAFIGQPDGPVLLARKNPGEAKNIRQVGYIHREYLHVLCNKASGVDNLADITDDQSYKIAIGEQGSGAWLIWQNFIHEDDSYANVATTTESGPSAESAVAIGDTTCMLVPAGLNNTTVSEADTLYGDQLVLAEATDKDFNNALDIKGNQLYEFEEIPGGTYKVNLQTGLFGSSVDTVSWKAGVYVNTKRITDPKALNAFTQAVARARPEIEQNFGK